MNPTDSRFENMGLRIEELEKENAKLLTRLELSDDWHTDEPLAYLVKCYDTTMHEYKVFANEREAESYAAGEEDKASDAGEPCDFLIYPLYPGNPKKL